jgi:hypothetical protein
MLVFGALASLWALLALARWAFSPSAPPPTDEQGASADAGVVSEVAAPASPDWVADLAARVEEGERLSSDERRELRAWQRAHAAAPEASLVLARDATLRGWHDAAIQRYGIALGLDPSLAQRPAVRAGLLRAATSETVGDRASGMVRTLYGATALAQARELLAHTRGRAERRRLRGLIRTLRALPDAGG